MFFLEKMISFSLKKMTIILCGKNPLEKQTLSILPDMAFVFFFPLNVLNRFMYKRKIFLNHIIFILILI